MKPLKNAEQKLREQMEKEGWTVTHKGWPDFACIRNGEMLFIEVKSYRGEMLKQEQHYIMTNLAKLGLKCYKWTIQGGFEQILGGTPFIEQVKTRRRAPRLTLQEKFERLPSEEQAEIKKLEASGKTVYL